MSSNPSATPAHPLLTNLPWVLGSTVSLLAIYVWGSSMSWQFADLSIYQLFPLLGLVAFSVMWSQYMVGILSQTIVKGMPLESYYQFSGYLVLVLIVLHPGLLIYQRFHDGFGLPPNSYESYVTPGMAWLTLLGSACLLVFLAYELKRWFSQRKWWHYIGYMIDAAMLGIFYHALELGTQTHIGWFRWIWWFYGLTLLGVLIHKYVSLLRRKK